MAHFLILRETTELLPVRKALELEPVHRLSFASDSSKALNMLEREHFDMIISAVYLESGDMFSFLCAVKDSPSLKQVPFICFSARQTERARSLNELISNTAVKLGANAFLLLDSFCKGDQFDFEGIRRAIENELCRFQREPFDETG